MKRLFIGIPIQSGTARQLTQGWSMDRSININRIAWTRPENWHATFFFLSATAESQLTLLEQLIDEAFNDIEPITIQLNGLGVFPDKGKPRILWVGLENLEPLLPAYGALDD
ncbi:MAG TPA: RNA 2',3'-cyclic phosphodiesterase, partial [Prolixibacteraceae bacterium]